MHTFFFVHKEGESQLRHTLLLCLSGVSGQASSNQSYFYVMFTILSVFLLFYTAKKVCFWENQVVTMLNMFV